jgi:hypothetical protein
MQPFHSACRLPLFILPGGVVCWTAFILQEPEDPDDKAVQVGDISQLDYAAGGEDDEEQPKDVEGGDKQQALAQEQGGE